jgi:acetyltransferase
MGDSVMKSGKQLLDMGKIPNSKYPEQTAIMLSHLHTFTSLRTKIFLKEYDQVPVVLSNQSSINEQDPLTTLMEYKIPVPPYVFVQDSATLSSALSSLAKTLVIKIISPDIIHKSDVGAIQLNVPKEHVCVIAEEMITKIKKTHPSISIKGILVMDMVDTHKGQECIVGVKKIPNLGTVIMFGIGGIFVEIMKDVTFRFAPLTRGDAVDLIEELQSSQIFNGVRGKPALDKDALIETLVSVSRLVEEHPEIQELDINPLVVFPQGEGVMALDARAKTQ